MWHMTLSGLNPKDVNKAHRLFKKFSKEVLDEFEPTELGSLEFRSSEGHTEDVLTSHLHKEGRMTAGEAAGTHQSPQAQLRAQGIDAPEFTRVPIKDSSVSSTNKSDEDKEK